MELTTTSILTLVIGLIIGGAIVLSNSSIMCIHPPSPLSACRRIKKTDILPQQDV